jgi:hypothetical protein
MLTTGQVATETDMSIASALGRLAGINSAPVVRMRPTDNNARRALLARSMQGRGNVVVGEVVPEVERTHGQMATDFSNWMLSSKGVDITKMDEGDAVKFDRYVDIVRESGSNVLKGVHFDEAAAWVGERLRREINLSWTDEGLVTDGRLTFDPAAVLRSRLDSDAAQTVRDALVESHQRFELEGFTATVA